MAKDKRNRLPKRIGGVKLPRKARKQANKAIAALNQPMVRELAAAALAAAAAAARRGAETTAAKPAAIKSEARAARSGGAQFAELAAAMAMAALGKWLAKAGTPGEVGPGAIKPEPGVAH